MIKDEIEAKKEAALDTVRYLLKAYDFDVPWPGRHGKLIKRLNRLMKELDALKANND